MKQVEPTRVLRLLVGAAVALYAFTAMAQTARDIRGPAPVVTLASEPFHSDTRVSREGEVPTPDQHGATRTGCLFWS